MEDTDRVLELLRKAVAILEGEREKKPTPIRQLTPNEDEITLEGTLGKFEIVKVGIDLTPLFRGTMKVRTPEGPERWIKFNAWRKVAIWAENNLTQGQVIRAVGRWETNSYVNRDGQEIETTVFSARLIQAA
jgi:hypothetical protein